MRRTIEISTSIDLESAPDEVWSYVENYANDVRWRRGVVEMVPTPPGPPAVGTTVREVMKANGSTFESSSVVVAVGHRSYRFEGTADTGPIRGSRSVEARAHGCCFSYAVSLDLRGGYALAAPLIERSIRRRMRGDLRRLATAMAEVVPR